MSDFAKEIHNMFDHIWDCEIDHPVYQDTVGELMEAVIQAYEKHNLTHGTNLASLGTDLISRQAAINAIDECYCGGEDSCGEPWIYKENAVEAIQMIERLPPAQPKRGRWIHDGSKWTNRWICSECGYKWFFDCIEGAYCPNCGADMRGEQG